MRILILEDEPVIALDLEDTVRQNCGCEVVVVNSLAEAAAYLGGNSIDFALLDIRLNPNGETSFPIADALSERHVPFCFVSSTIDRVPECFVNVPKVMKPFGQSAIEAVLP